MNLTGLLSLEENGSLLFGAYNISHLLKGVKKNQNPGFKLAIESLNLYLTPVIVIIGVLTNTLSFLVFTLTPLKRQSSSVYLAALAVADTGFLVALFIGWLSWVKINIYHQNGWCQIAVYLNYVCIFLSVWNVVCFTAERYIVVCYPFKRNVFCTVSRAKKIVLTLVVISLVMYSFAPWTTGILHVRGTTVCNPYPKYFDLVDVIMNIDTVITLVLPSLLIICLNIRIALKVYRAIHRHSNCAQHTNGCSHGNTRLLATWNRGSSEGNNGAGPSNGGSVSMHVLRSSPRCVRCRMQTKTTRMLLIVSTVFVTLNLSSHAFRVHAFIVDFNMDEYRVPDITLRIHEVVQFLYYLNFSINFFLYSLSAKRFRTALAELCSQWRLALGNWCRLRKRPSFQCRCRNSSSTRTTSQNCHDCFD